MAAHIRFGGHMVQVRLNSRILSPQLMSYESYDRSIQGHVDATVSIVSREVDGNSLRITFRGPEPTPTRPSLMPYIIMKGYVTLDGASLTITTVDDAERTFGVMLIAHTQASINLANKEVGERVNVEVDMVGKYVEKAVTAALTGEGSVSLQAQIENTVERILARKQA